MFRSIFLTIARTSIFSGRHCLSNSTDIFLSSCLSHLPYIPGPLLGISFSVFTNLSLFWFWCVFILTILFRGLITTFFIIIRKVILLLMIIAFCIISCILILMITTVFIIIWSVILLLMISTSLLLFEVPFSFWWLVLPLLLFEVEFSFWWLALSSVLFEVAFSFWHSDSFVASFLFNVVFGCTWLLFLRVLSWPSSRLQNCLIHHCLHFCHFLDNMKSHLLNHLTGN